MKFNNNWSCTQTKLKLLIINRIMYQVNIITGSSITEVNQITLIQTYLTVMQAYLVVKCEKFTLKEITVYLIHVLEVKKIF